METASLFSCVYPSGGNLWRKVEQQTRRCADAAELSPYSQKFAHPAALTFLGNIVLVLVPALPVYGQAITISDKPSASDIIDRRYAQVQPTSVDLPRSQIDARGHQDIRITSSRARLAMRPLPKGKKG